MTSGVHFVELILRACVKVARRVLVRILGAISLVLHRHVRSKGQHSPGTSLYGTVQSAVCSLLVRLAGCLVRPVEQGSRYTEDTDTRAYHYILHYTSLHHTILHLTILHNTTLDDNIWMMITSLGLRSQHSVGIEEDL